MSKARWTCEDDFALFLGTQLHGNDWNCVSAFLNARKSAKQCRERWCNHLDPSIRDTEWTHDDILTLLLHVGIYGSKWSHISQQMPVFSPNAIKNKYKTIQRSLGKECVDPLRTLLRYYYFVR